MSSTLKTFILMAALTALLGVMGHVMAGTHGALIALGVAAAMNFFSYWYSDRVILKLYKAREVDAFSAPNLYQTVSTLATRAGLPMPKVYIIDNDQPNAFATGRNPQNAAVAATRGLLKILTPDEVAGVMAHELAHIKNRDTLIMTITATVAGAVSMLANFAMLFAHNRNGQGTNPIIFILISILAPLAAMIVQMAISRTREYSADRVGAEISGHPQALASALHKIAGGTATHDNPAAEDNPATAHMFIINPLHMHAIDGLFSTHPRTEERIRRLLAMVDHGPTNTSPAPDPFAPAPDTFRQPWNGA